MTYRKVPWKCNYREIPLFIREALEATQSDFIVIASAKKIAVRDIAAGVYAHVGLRLADGSVVAEGPVLPPSEAGKWSERNASGWDRKRLDWPMVTKTYIFETPNFGDAATYGTHTHFSEREVYQRQVFEPQGMQIETEILDARGDEYIVVKFALSPILNRRQPEFELMLLWSLNVLQENTGVTGVFASEATQEYYLATIQLDWELFPPGTIDEVVARFARRPANPRNTPDFDRYVRDRIALFNRLNPKAYLRGQGSFGSYFGAQFADDLVVFENLKYGNALYVLYEDWDTVSKRSRIDLLRDHDANFDRIIHTDDWKHRFAALIRYQLEKRQRKGRDLFRRK